jgi:hypothetical protein
MPVKKLPRDLERTQEADEVETVLAALQTLIASTESPIVRACLEEAHDDIAHLTAQEDAQAEEQIEAA